MFENFHRAQQGEIHFVYSGNGPPLLLLHGFPQTHIAWRKIAPHLAELYTVVVPDLPGYGDSHPLQSDSPQMAHSKRAMAQAMVDLMNGLGFTRFAVAGHDRGGRVAYRLALDFPEHVTRLVLLNIIPTLEMMERINPMTFFNWFFLAQHYPLPETLIGCNPDFYIGYIFRSWLGQEDAIEPEAMEQYLRSFRKAEVLHATCEEYRAGMTVDIDHDRLDRENGRLIDCPVLVLWCEEIAEYDPLMIWRRWAKNVTGKEIRSGHFLMEEAPDATRNELLSFLS